MEADLSLVVIKSNEGDRLFKLTKAEAALSVTLRDMLADFGGDAGQHAIPLALAESTLDNITQFLKHEVTSTREKNQEKGTGKYRVIITPITTWDQIFLDRLFKAEQKDEFVNVFMGANFLDIRPLIDLCSQYLSDQLKGKSPEEMRDLLQIENDFTPEEEAKIRSENEWYPKVIDNM